MLRITQLSSRGQITIPASIRKLFALEKNKQILLWLRIKEEEIVIKPLTYPDLSELRGSVKPKKKPEDWSSIRKEVKKRIAQRIASI